MFEGELMKKFLSLFLVLIIAFSFCSVSAETNYCEFFEKQFGCFSRLQDYGNETTPWSANSIAYVTSQNLDYSDYYNEEKSDPQHGIDCYSVPKDLFENCAKMLFDVKVDLTTANYNDMLSVVFDADKQTYDVITKAAGGASYYQVYGYKQSGNIYSVYLQIVSETNENVLEYALVTCTKNGEYAKVISFETISSLPNISTLTTWPKEEKPVPPVIATVSKETASVAPSSSKPASTNVSSNVSSNTSSEVSSETTSEVNTTDDPNDIAEVDVLLENDELFISADVGVFPENTIVTATKIETAEGIEALNTSLENIAKTYVAYDITALSNNAIVQPNGKVYATFNIPATFNIDKVMVLHVAEDGLVTEAPFVVDKASEKITAELTHFSTYVIIEATDDYLGTNSGGSVVAIVISIVFVLACAGVYAWYMLYYKKKLQK